MNASLKASLVRSTAIALFAGAALLLSACSTASVTSASIDAPANTNEKTVTYADLHNMMTTLAQQPELGSAESLTGTLPIASVSIDASHTLASNP
jgi:hypothetical protein